MRLFTWQVTHQAAVKSTNTGLPSARTRANASADHGCQPLAVGVGAAASAKCVPSFACHVGHDQTATASTNAAAAARATAPLQRAPKLANTHSANATATSSASSAAAP